MPAVGKAMDRELKILIVEDVPQDARAMENALKAEEFRFQSRRLDTREAFLTALEEFAPDVVLSDFTLPDFDALEALRLLKEHQYDIPLILVTGSMSEEVAVECIKEGADDYLLKASLKRLPTSIQNVLQKKAAERERRQAELALRRSEEQFRLITETTHDLISLVDVAGRFLYTSPSFRRALGYIPERLIGTSSYELVHPEDQAVFQQSLQEALATKTGVAADYRYRHQGGSWRMFESTGNWIWDEHGTPQRCVIVARNITRRKETEAVLRSLPRLIRDAQETERRRVARELHDSVNQTLASAKFRMETVEEKLQATQPAAWRETLKARTLLERAMNEVRRISRNLRPSELDDLGLIPAVRSLCSDFSERTGLPVELDIQQLPIRLSTALELDLYRIIQEALNNIERHAKATRASLRVVRNSEWLQLAIRDDGCGFDPQAAGSLRSRRPGMGLMDMQERAAFNGAQWRVITAPNAGTEILIQIPRNQLKFSKHARKNH
jgi:PAS domain S-box-containing protein